MNSEEPFTSNGELSTNCRDDLDVRVGFFFFLFLFFVQDIKFAPLRCVDSLCA